MILYRCATCGSLRILESQPGSCRTVLLQGSRFDTRKPRVPVECRGEMQAITAEPIGAGPAVQ